LPAGVGKVNRGKGGQVFLFWKIGGYFGITYPGIASVVFRMEEARRSNKQIKIEPSPLTLSRKIKRVKGSLGFPGRKRMVKMGRLFYFL